MHFRTRTSISLEAIKYQTNKQLYKAIVTYLQMMRDTNTDQVEAFQSIQNEIIRAIEYHKKMPVEFKIVDDGPTDYTLAVLPPVFTEKHPLVTGRFTNSVAEKSKLGVLKELYHNPDHILEFGVDYDKGVVTGFARELPSTIYIGTSLLRDGNIKPEWLASGLIHEIGHIETFYLSLRYVTSSSWAIRFAIEMLDETEDANDFLVTAEKIGSVLAAQDVIRIKEVDDRAKKEMVTAIIMDKFRDRTRSEIGTSFADQTSTEALADQFLVRYGDALAFAQFMDYVSKQKQPAETRRVWVNAALQGVGIMVVCSVLAPILGAGSVMAGAAIGSIVGNAAIASASATEVANTTAYDRPYDRVKRMRNDLVAVVKSADDPKARGQILNEIKALDEVLPDLKKYDGLLAKIQPLFSSSLRKLRREQNLVQNLEELFNNPLYIRQAQLSQLNEPEE